MSMYVNPACVCIFLVCFVVTLHCISSHLKLMCCHIEIKGVSVFNLICLGQMLLYAVLCEL